MDVSELMDVLQERAGDNSALIIIDRNQNRAGYLQKMEWEDGDLILRLLGGKNQWGPAQVEKEALENAKPPSQLIDLLKGKEGEITLRIHPSGIKSRLTFAEWESALEGYDTILYLDSRLTTPRRTFTDRDTSNAPCNFEETTDDE